MAFPYSTQIDEGRSLMNSGNKGRLKRGTAAYYAVRLAA